MMNAAFAELGLDWRYLALPLPPERFAQTVRAMPGSGYRAANVTIPHKLAALEVADELTETARGIGAVNTLTFFEDGRIAGDNTDAGGLLDALGEPLPASALVLGAGGAARAAVWALREAGLSVSVWGRTARRAQALARELGVEAGGVDAELLVNATPVGLHREDTLEGLPLIDARVVADLVYSAGATPLARWADERGARLVDGVEVLVRQGARSFRVWTGLEPPVETMRRAAVQAASSTSAQA